jgi:hypothetical protein
MKDATVVRRQRSRSLDMMYTDSNTEILEAVKSILLHPFKRTKQKNEEIHLARSYEQSKEDLKSKYRAYIRNKAGQRVTFEVDTAKHSTHYSIGLVDESEETHVFTLDVEENQAVFQDENNVVFDEASLEVRRCQ